MDEAELEELRAMKSRLDELIARHDTALRPWRWTSRPYTQVALEQMLAALVRVRDGDEK